jgi:hypothetical protein
VFDSQLVLHSPGDRVNRSRSAGACQMELRMAGTQD